MTTQPEGQTPRTDAVCPHLNLSHGEMRYMAWKLRSHSRTLERENADLRQQLAAAEARTVEMCAAQRSRVPILPGDMPDEMWAAIAGDRNACSESLRIVIRQTLDEYEAAIRALLKGGFNE
jgi:hypothetical protein